MNLNEILKAAIEIEQQGIRHYTKSAEKVKDENGRGTLLFLAKEEEKHKQFFKEMLETHGKGSEHTMERLKVPRVFPEKHEYKEGSATSVDQQVLEHAKKLEEKSIEFYSSALAQAKENALKKGLQTVISEEKQHLHWIETLLSSISAHGYWTGLENHFGTLG